MADTSYTYSVASDFPQAAVSPEKLEQDVLDSAISSAVYLYVTIIGDACALWFDGPLTGGDEALLDDIVASHDAVGLEPVQEGGVVVVPLSPPSGLAVVPQGSGGSTSWGYSVTAFSATGETLECAEALINTGAAVLDGTNFNRLTWDAVPGAVKYAVYRTTAGGTPSSVGRVRLTALTECNDKGLAASGGLPSEDRSGAIVIGGEVTAESTKKLDVRELTTDDSTVSSLVAITRRSTAQVLAGFGTGLFVRLADDADVMRDAGALHVLWDDPATAVRRSAARIMLRSGGSALVERLRLDHDGTLSLAGDEVVGVGTCRVGFPVDTGIRGGSAAASSNNDVPSVTFAAAAESRIRWTCRPPQNRTSGDLTLRALCSFAGSPGNTGVRWRLDWSCLSAGDAIPASYQNTVEFTQNEADKSNDVLFNVDFAIPAAQFDAGKDMLVLWLRRDGDHVGDTCTLIVHVHMVELRYTGRRLAGQAGQ